MHEGRVHPLIRVLEELGVDFEAKEHKSYRFKADGMMDLVVETWAQNDGLHLSVAHYGEQNGDLMADPEMEFLVGEGEIGPVVNALVRELPVVRIGRKRYFVDERFGQLRNVKNPHDWIELDFFPMTVALCRVENK